MSLDPDMLRRNVRRVCAIERALARLSEDLGSGVAPDDRTGQAHAYAIRTANVAQFDLIGLRQSLAMMGAERRDET